MTIVGHGLLAAEATAGRIVPLRIAGGAARIAVGVVLIAAVAASLLITDGDAAAQAASTAGADLTRLLRFMAAIKAVLAFAAVGAVLWRLAAPVALPRLIAYGLACGAMGAGPGLIWTMAHVGLGALLLHGGLLCALALLYRDPAVTLRMEAALARRRQRRPARTGR